MQMKKTFRRISMIISLLLLSSIGAGFLYFKTVDPEYVYAESGVVDDVQEAAIEELPEEYCLRDEYVIFGKDQDMNGYCWNFASAMAAETTIMKATNEYYDFSELWIGAAKSANGGYIPGNGGFFDDFYSAINAYGVVLETDLPYQNSTLVSKENADDFYNFFKNYANDDIASLLYYDSANCRYTRSNVEGIKKHLLNHGSLYLSMTFSKGWGLHDENGIYYKVPNQNSFQNSHALSIIGWDDNFEREVYLNGSDTPTTFKGAWLILNSWSEDSEDDGVFYMFYNDTDINTIQGFRYVKDTSKSLYFYDKLEYGYSYPTNVVGKYYGDRDASSGLTKQQNILYDEVDLEYSYEISSGASIKSIKIGLIHRI